MDDLKDMFEKSQSQQKEKMEFTEGESANFKKAFDDPEFRKMFTEYMDEMQDPNNRQETEDYIKQLEGEQKVPQGKELVRPKACFVAKTYKLKDGQGGDKAQGDKVQGDKVFINIVTSESIMKPSKTSTPEGDTWSLPYSLGPPHMEKDKNDSNVACFDCCYHPLAVAQMDINKRFRDSLVVTAIEGVEEAYKRQKQDTKMSREYHVLKGVTYKQGLIPAMLVDTATKNQEWNADKGDTKDKNEKGDTNDTNNASDNNNSNSSSKINKSEVKSDSKETEVKKSVPVKNDFTATSVNENTAGITNPVKSSPAIKRGFLNDAKTTVYPESVSAKVKKTPSASPSILLPGRVMGDVSDGGVGTDSGSGSLVQELTEAELLQLKKTGTVKTAKSAHTATATATSSMTASMTERSTTKTQPPSTITSSSSSSTSSQMDPTTPSTPSPQTPNPTPNPKQPSYTLIERGVVSMGDFESLKQKVASNRPAELVIKISVPLVTKASLMVLDVAERLLKFSYLDSYELSVTLPYPVFDKKGVAKYDKTGKTLTVTMPVHPPAQPEGTRASSITAVNENSSSNSCNTDTNDNNDNNDNNVNNVNNDGSNNSDGKDKEKEAEAVITPEAAEKKKKSNARWVGGDEGNLREESRMRSEELKREIAAQVLESQSLQPPVQPVPSVQGKNTVPSAGKTVTFDVKTEGPSSSSFTVEDGYIASPTFLGKKEGFIFQKGPKGQGYYRDKRSTALPSPPTRDTPLTAPAAPTPSTPIPATGTSPSITPPSPPNSSATIPSSATPSTTSSTSSSASSVPNRMCPYEYRQTKQAVSVLIHVPRILLGSASVSFSDHTVDVTFKAERGSDSGIGTSNSGTQSEDNHVNPTISSSPITGRITSDNTAANSSSLIAGKNGSSSSHDNGSNGNSGNIVYNGDIDTYGFQLVSSGLIDKSQCKYDIASQNMVFVLFKAQEGYWEEGEGEGGRIVSMVPLKEGNRVSGSSVSPEAELIHVTEQKEGREKKAINSDGKLITNKKDSKNSLNSGKNSKSDGQLVDQLEGLRFTTQAIYDLD